VSAVEVRELRRAYGALVAVDEVTFTASAGAVTAVLGPNGAGKTTTVEICAGLRRRDAGEVTVLGTNPWRATTLRARVGVMPQAAGSGAAGVYPAARVREVLALHASFARAPLPVDGLLDRLDLARVAHTPWRRLSGGEQQRLSLALAIVGRPELVFLDEPTAGLDVHARHETWSLVEELRAAGVTVLLTTHAMDEAERLADHVVVLARGRVVAAGTTGQLTAGAADAITFTAVPGLPVGELAAHLHATVEESVPGTYVVAGAAGPGALAALTGWCSERGVLPSRISTGRRSLEEVYLELTGEPAP
jgi:ABC-2 type transport system ATP-binding protein